VDESGLTSDEQAVMDRLVDAWNLFVQMERTHKDELREFADAIHRLQDMLALRIVRRSYPIYWRNSDG
jgi:hypothetical protein